jgi:hypothetical protein
MRKLFFSAALLGASALPLFAAQPQASTGCTNPNGSLFNLEPRTNAVVQVARSGTATDQSEPERFLHGHRRSRQ